MPIPETPYTREEAYLNAIATGDSSGIPEMPYTREEMYLDYIARNGGGGGGGSSTLSGLTDVDISNPSNGQTLVYNSTSGKWENGANCITRLTATYDSVNDKSVLSATWQEIYNAVAIGVVCVDGVATDFFYRETVDTVYAEEGEYYVETSGPNGRSTYRASSASGHPEST